MSAALNLEAPVARCVLVFKGRVVAGRFWCSYAWVSLTPTARARPRVRGLERGCARVRV